MYSRYLAGTRTSYSVSDVFHAVACSISLADVTVAVACILIAPFLEYIHVKNNKKRPHRYRPLPDRYRPLPDRYR